MSDLEESKKPTLDYQNNADDRTQRGVHAVLLFGIGFVFALVGVGFVSALVAGAIIALTGSNAGGAFFAAIVLVGFGIVAAVATVRRLRQTRGEFLALGFLCGACIVMLLEGLCFGGIAFG